MSLFLRFHNQLDENKRFNSLKKLLHQEFNLINNHMYLIFFLFWGESVRIEKLIIINYLRPKFLFLFSTTAATSCSHFERQRKGNDYDYNDQIANKKNQPKKL